MTDLTKGIIEIDGLTITPHLTQIDFEAKFNGIFQKDISDETITFYTLNGKVARLPNREFNPTLHKKITINDMSFINVVVIFRNGKIEKIELISDLQYYELDAVGKKKYSPSKEDECHKTMFEWACSNFGKPSYEHFLFWNYEWGCLKVSIGISAHCFYVEYGRNYNP